MTKKTKGKPDISLVRPMESERGEPLTDAELAAELRSKIAGVAALMNISKQRGLQVNFNINETDGVFKENVDVRRINVEVL